MHSTAAGSTLAEVIVAVVLLEAGLLGVLATTALVSRVMSVGERSAAAALAAEQRLEALRQDGCAANGHEVLLVGLTPVDSLAWQSVSLGEQQRELVLRSHYLVPPGRWRTDTFDAEIPCAG
ncbi:MAG TPA: hypothetical protein VLT79_07800 [Gemmatimonadales bacterium]|nr:hypothetical protein [Gemmatimonadales bacterium]